MATGNLNVASINDGQLGGFRNLIINGNFQVNQRGHYSITEETSGTPATGYHYDRWYYDGTYLYQGIEDKNVFNGTYTLSWQDAGSDITASYVVSTDTNTTLPADYGPDSGLTWTSVSNGGNITVNEGTEFSKHLWVRFGGTLTNLSKVQLEVGSTATAFEHRPYGVELALCQRYYQKSFKQSVAPKVGATVSDGFIYTSHYDYSGGLGHIQIVLQGNMRTAPSVVFYPTSSTSGTTGDISYYDGAWKTGTAVLYTAVLEATLNMYTTTSANVSLIQFNYTADAEL